MAAAASSTTPLSDHSGIEDSATMPEEVFKWMTHAVNQAFLGMGYPAILIKLGEQEFVNLCPLIRNCTSVLTLLKARRYSIGNDDASASVSSSTAAPASSSGTASTLAAAATTTTNAAGTNRRKRRRWGLFWSGRKHRRAGRQQQQQQLAVPAAAAGATKVDSIGSSSSTSRNISLHESMARKMRKDTERIIRRTGCLSQLDTAAAVAACPASPYPACSQDQRDFVFMHATWRSFRKVAQSRLAQSVAAARRTEELQREIASLTAQLERLRQGHGRSTTPAAADDTSSSSLTVSTTGPLQRVGGFLRRAVSKERLTFGRRRPASGTTSADSVSCGSEEAACTSVQRCTRSSSVPGGRGRDSAASQSALAEASPEAQFRRLRLEFERRERLLLSEREKLRQANSKLNFRVQHLSSVAAAAAKQGCGGGGGSRSGKDADLHMRRLERRAAALQKEVTSLKRELSERIDSVIAVGAAVTKLSRAAATVGGTSAGDAAEELLPTEAGRVQQLVDSACQSVLARLRQLHQAAADSEAREASLRGCLQLVRSRLGLTRAAVDNARAMQVELDAIAACLATRSSSSAALAAGSSTPMSAATVRSRSVSSRQSCCGTPATTACAAVGSGDQKKLELRDRIIGKLTAMLRDRQDEVRRLKDMSTSCQDISRDQQRGGHTEQRGPLSGFH